MVGTYFDTLWAERRKLEEIRCQKFGHRLRGLHGVDGLFPTTDIILTLGFFPASQQVLTLRYVGVHYSSLVATVEKSYFR